MINFDKLPDELPKNEFPLIEKGIYTATIEKAEMKQPKDPNNKKPYLNLTWNIYDDNNQSLGKLYDIMTESENPYVQYKLKSFINALGVNLGQEFELKDLCKVSTGKTCKIAITIDEKSEPNKNTVNIFHQPPYAKVLVNPVEDNDTNPFVADEPSTAKASY